MAANYGHTLPMREELEDLFIGDIVLTVGFALVLSGGLSGAAQSVGAFVRILPICFMAVTLSFVLHEYMHKLVAQRFGAMAAFRRSDQGIMFTILTAMFGFLMAIVGATIIYTNSFTKREEGIVSLAGPLTNFVVFLVFFGIAIAFHMSIVYPPDLAHFSYLQNAVGATLFISALLAAYNMLPMYPLDGSKVLRWNKPVFVAMILVTFGFLAIVIPLSSLIVLIVIWAIIALLFSLFYRSFTF